MARKNSLKMRLKRAIFGCFFVAIGLFTGLIGNVVAPNNAVAIVDGNSEVVENVNTNEEEIDNGEEKNEVEGENSENNDEGENNPEETTTGSGLSNSIKDVNCKASLGAIGWLVCPTTGKISEAVDWLYDKIQGILEIDPISMESDSPIYEIWKYCLGLTNAVFVIFLLVVIYSQITGFGINNYGIKKVLPKLIVTAVLVNLSFLLCSIAVDLSNITGAGLRGLFTTVEETVIANRASTGMTADMKLTYAQMYRTLAEGGLLAVGAGFIAFETGAIWMLIPVVLGSIVSVVSGLITIALRQAVVALLVMISPLAIVAYILPNTEKWFTKWKDLLLKMLIFYPMFSLLFGASSLAGYAIIASAKDGFGLLLGTAVKIFPLFFSWSLMKMSGTFLGTINAKMQGLASRPLAMNKDWADSHRQLSKQRHLASNRAYTPSLRLMQFMSDRKVAREAELGEHQETVKNRGLAYKARKNYNKKGVPTRRGERAYSEQADNMKYQEIIARDKNNFNKGLGYLAKEGTSKRARLDELDVKNVNAADMLFAENARGERVEYENAIGRHKRFEDAVNAHFDKENKDDPLYKIHDIKNRAEAEERYKALDKIAEGEVVGLHYSAAAAAQAYDTQKKIVETKMQKYFELTPPTKDVVNRLNELTRVDVKKNERAADNIDSIISGMRVLNQRGDTDLVRDQLKNVLNKNIGGGVKLGTHASQALASFLMFEVKGSDPFLRRFGKYINLETANVYNKNRRKSVDISYDEFFKGYHEEPNGERMYAKKSGVKLMEGTSLDEVERTAFSSFDDGLKQAYGFDPSDSKKDWDVEGYLKKRGEFQTAMEPAFLSASLKWLSGSEQMNSGVKFWTGYELKQREDKDGNLIINDDEPVYGYIPVWDDPKNGFGKYKDVVKEDFRKKSRQFIKDQTPAQIWGLRTDYRDPLMYHFFETYLKEGTDKKTPEECRREFEEAKAEINGRYTDESDQKKAELKREKDLLDYMFDVDRAGQAYRDTLDENGKLEQLLVSRRTSRAGDAKDWNRKYIKLDDKEFVEGYLYKKEQERKAVKEAKSVRDAGDADADGYNGVYEDNDRIRMNAMIEEIFEDSSDDPDPSRAFYESSIKLLRDNFGSSSEVEARYRKYREDCGDRVSIDSLRSELDRILIDFFDNNSH